MTSLQPRGPGNDQRLSVKVSGRLLVDGYKKGNYAIDSPRFPQRPVSSLFVDLKDPIQVHLLTETALADSRNYEVLSQDQVDMYKKQCQYLAQRIDQTKANLTVQTKYRDAAVTMAKLFTPGPDGNLADGAREAEDEREEAEKRCEELASELFQLEKNLMEPQRRLLEHTAAILQLTHRASHKKQALQQLPNGLQLVNGMPGSPESLYTYSTNRSSLASNEDLNFEDSNQLPQPQVNALEIPIKSPIREQTNRLREDLEQLKEDNARLSQENEQLRQAEQKLGSLNEAMRDLVISFNPAENAEYPSQPLVASPGQSLIDSKLDYLERGIQMARQEQEYLMSNGNGGNQEQDNSEHQSRLRSVNGIVLAMLANAGAAQPPSPGPSGKPLEDEITYLERAIETAEKALGPRGTVDVSTTSGNVESELKMIWDSMQSRAAFMKQDKENRKKQRAEKGLPEDEDDDMDDEDVNEPYSFIAFTSKVNWMASRVRRLADEKIVLKRQIKQQRELNQKADAEEVMRLQSELDNKTDELIETRTQLTEIKGHLETARAEVSKNEAALQIALRDMQDLTEARAMSNQQDSKAKTLESELREKNLRISALEETRADLESRAAAAEASKNDAETARQQAEARLTHSESTRKELELQVSAVDGKISSLAAQLAEANTARAAINDALETKQKEVDMKARQVQEKEDLLESMNLMLAELKTELTIAQAELDGAYGSRAERAKDIAAMKSTLEMQKMQTETDSLRKELASTVRQLEELAGSSIAAEKEKTDIEARLDAAEQLRTQLEADLADVRARLDAQVLASRERMAQLQADLDAERLRAPATGAAGAAKSAAVLSEQFRTAMREERKKFQEEIKEEQGRRRRVEEELTRLRRAAGIPVRTPLTPNPPAL
ncbi:hypothetical protein TD95_005275 [Thielaviopsis punctulata]|uniref:Uncharacterized protein n=1 Tax=Thielaviopsis punctulata TaxID=72032 RepID=A0A0F4ZBI5_9PEZI|nr:hypothetical protein TD95_005275 [Thielaviopsis punctulata]